MNKNILISKIVKSAMIAAAYFALTIAVMPIAFGAMQFRISEALTVLPCVFPEAIGGLFVGCLLSNLFSPVTPLDIIVGSLATLLAAFLTSKIKNKYLAPLPPVIINAIAIGFVLTYAETGLKNFALETYFMNFASILVCQAAVCYLLGVPLLICLKKFFGKNKREKLKNRGA